MKSLFLVLIFTVLVSSNLLAQSKSSNQVSLDAVQTLLEQSEKKAAELETLENFYNRLSAELILTDGLVDAMLNPANTRFGGATADCADGTSVSCSGTTCTSTDNVGCACASSDGEGGTVLDWGFCGVGIVGIQ